MVKIMDCPGTAQHQSLLRAIVSHYENDPRILAVSVFGSLGRGNWDAYSDIDLDVVVADAARIDIGKELAELSASFELVHQEVAFTIPDEDDACDVVFKSLMELSVRFHPLSNTSPNIVDSLQLLMGRIDRTAVATAGLANQKPEGVPLEQVLDRCIRHAIEVDSALHRNQIWPAVELLHLMRGALMELFTRAHQGRRAYQYFQKEASPALQIRLGAALPQYDLRSAGKSFSNILDFLISDFELLTDGRIHLTEAHRTVLNAIRAREKDLRV